MGFENPKGLVQAFLVDIELQSGGYWKVSEGSKLFIRGQSPFLTGSICMPCLSRG